MSWSQFQRCCSLTAVTAVLLFGTVGFAPLAFADGEPAAAPPREPTQARPAAPLYRPALTDSLARMQTAYERSLAITVRVHGEHSAEVAACCNSLAIVLEIAQRYGASITLADARPRHAGPAAPPPGALFTVRFPLATTGSSPSSA
jgi:hypothetical protein